VGVADDQLRLPVAVDVCDDDGDAGVAADVRSGRQFPDVTERSAGLLEDALGCDKLRPAVAIDIAKPQTVAKA
jgi:hypothetical protein